MEISTNSKYRIQSSDGKKACAIYIPDPKNASCPRLVAERDSVPGSGPEDWRFIKLEDGTYEIMSENPNNGCRGLCLTTQQVEQGVYLSPWKYRNNDDQKWILQEVPDKQDVYRITPKMYENVNDVLTFSNSTDFVVIIAELHKTNEEFQIWRLQTAV
jgi:hypothetical protein